MNEGKTLKDDMHCTLTGRKKHNVFFSWKNAEVVQCTEEENDHVTHLKLKLSRNRQN